MSVKVRHDPVNAFESKAAVVAYCNAAEEGDSDAEELFGFLARAGEALDAEVHALRRSLGR